MQRVENLAEGNLANQVEERVVNQASPKVPNIRITNLYVILEQHLIRLIWIIMEPSHQNVQDDLLEVLFNLS